MFLSVVRQNLLLITKLGIAFFANAYNLLVIDFVLSILSDLNDQDPTGLGFTLSTTSLLASATSVGAIVGMVSFGIIADMVGRTLAVTITGILVMSGCVASSLCQRSESFPLVYQLMISQVVLGVGIGGEYPLSASIASECPDPKLRTRIVGSVFSMQGVGMLVSCLLPIIFLRSGVSLETTWRLLLGLGAVPAFIAFCFRLKTPPKSAIVRNTGKAQWSKVLTYWKPLAGCMLCWFLSDITVYGTGRFKHTIESSVYPVATDPTEQIINEALFGLIITGISLPGYFLTVYFGPRIGLAKIQISGFLVMAILFALFGLCVYLRAPPGLDVAILGLTFLFSNFGPNGAIFIIPGQIFPFDIRATCHGIAAAAGKVGSVVGGAGMPVALENLGLSNAMYICAGVGFMGFLAALLALPPVKIAILEAKLVTPVDLY